MTTYLHPDLDALQQALTQQNFVEVFSDDFSIWYDRGEDELLVHLPIGEVYESVNVDFHFEPGDTLLLLLGFPL